MRKFVYQYPAWPDLTWDAAALAGMLGEVRRKQGRFIGRLEAVGFSLRNRTMLDATTSEITDSFAIEGEDIDVASVRSSIARRLGLDLEGVDTSTASGHFVEGVVEMMIDASRGCRLPLTEDRLFGWHTALFPDGRSGLSKIAVGKYRTEEMRIVSGSIGKESIHYIAPEPAAVHEEMASFLAWVNGDGNGVVDGVIKAGIAHFRFIMIHPFDDGNGRLARAITEMLLARADNSGDRYYSLSSRMLKERKDYYAALEKGQYSEGDVTEWLSWYIGCLGRAVDDSADSIEGALAKADFWDKHKDVSFNARQQRMVNMLIDGFEGKVTTAKWGKITKCSHDTALRDIKDMIEKGVLTQSAAGGRSASYLLAR
ncbi:MAG: Fic family protein [Clostridiales Family XIII bacterium]|jgi:Fic family protein|nr:Fic family protein [Clostridiales Family XIII bacterium]